MIGGLPLPLALVAAIEAGLWQPPADDEVYVRVFGERPEQPEFYTLPMLVKQNASWQRRNLTELYGRPAPGAGPGVDPARSVVIGDLGLDMPFVLDYRETIDRPPVRYLRFDPRPRWVPVAEDVADLFARLGIG